MYVNIYVRVLKTRILSFTFDEYNRVYFHARFQLLQPIRSRGSFNDRSVSRLSAANVFFVNFETVIVRKTREGRSKERRAKSPDVIITES